MHIINKNNWQVWLFFSSVLLFYPLVWWRLFVGRLPYWNELTLFTPGLLALLCFTLLLFSSKTVLDLFSNRTARLPLLAFAFVLLIAFVQVVSCYNGRISYLWASFYWITIPLFCAVNRRQVEKYLPVLMMILGLASIVQVFNDIRFNEPFYGICGNWNWNASLIAIVLPFLCGGVYKIFRKYKILVFISNILIVSVGGVLFLYCDSRAAFLALCVSSCFILILRYWQKLPLHQWLRIALAVGVILLVLLLVFKNQLFIIIENDQRISLWSGAIELIRRNIWTGCGPELFESSYSPCVPASYYFSRLVETRHTHAHNHLLQFAATMGIPALCAWLAALVYVFIRNLRQAVGAGKWRHKLYLFIFVFLLVHSMFDIIILSWPLGCIFLIIFGIMLGRCAENSIRTEIKVHKYIIDVGYALAICCAVALLNYLCLNFLSSMYYRNARLARDKNDIKLTLAETRKSITYKATPWNTLLAAKISLYDFKNPQACLMFLDILEATGFKNYEHNNLLRAKALAGSGKLQESLLYFAQEQQNFPLSCVNLYYYQLILRKAGYIERSEAIRRHLKELLKLKGLNEKMLPLLLKDPGKDLRFIELKKQVK